MEKLKKWAKKKNLLKSATLFGIPQDHPETTPPGNCRFDVCIVISKEERLGGLICESEILSGKYLIFEVEHTAEDI